jgi:hypothetical protein
MPFAANRKIRAVIASPLAVAAVGLGAVVTGGHPAVAAACPNANAPVATAGASGAPAYTYIRGCIASFDSTPIVYNLYLPTTATAKHPA